MVMDTGCGHDLIGHREVLAQECPLNEAEKPMPFCTANGETHAKECLGVGVAEFNSIATPYVLCNTPAVLIVGRHCAEEGYAFVWKPAQDPYMITPEGMIVVLERKGYIPYLKVGSSQCAPFRPDDEDWFSLHSGCRHYMAAPAENEAGERDCDPPEILPVEGPEPDPLEEPAVADVEAGVAVDEALGIDVEDVRATERERANMVEHQLKHLRRIGIAKRACAGNAAGSPVYRSIQPFADQVWTDCDA